MEKPLHYHRRTKDAALAPLFGVYFQKLRGLYQGGVRWYRKTQPTPYWSAELRIDQENLSVSLVPRDAVGFEFFTTGKPVSTASVTQDGITYTVARAACVNVRAELHDEAITFRASILKNTRSVDGQELSQVGRPFQMALIDEPVREPTPVTYILDRPKYLKTLYESWAPGTSHSGVHLRTATQGFGANYLCTQWVVGLPKLHGVLQGAKGGACTHLVRDVGYDMPWGAGEGGKPATFALLNSDSVLPVPTPKTDWPRAAGLQTVKDATYGTRAFAVYVDSFNQVSVFPTGHMTAWHGTTQNVDQKYVKTASMGLPAWVWTPSTPLKPHWAATGDAGFTDFPENDWKLRHDGTKAVAVCYARVLATRDTDFTSSVSANAYHNYCLGVAARAQASVVGSSDHWWAAPGLVETTITITLTGPLPENYTLTVASATLRDPNTAEHCTLFAGYVWHDMPDNSAKQGDLCVWDVERYYRVPDMSELPDAWFPVSPGVTVSHQERVNTVAAYNHERYWGASRAREPLGSIPTHDHGIGSDYPDPGPAPWGTPGLTLDGLRPYGHDYWRTLYSLKNLTQSGRELRTLPGCPSGVAQGYAIAPNVDGERIILGDNVRSSYNGYHVTYSYKALTDFPLTPLRYGTLFSPYADAHDINWTLVQSHTIICAAKVSENITWNGGLIALPVHSRAQFLKVDMTTLSFVMRLHVGTQDWRRVLYHDPAHPADDMTDPSAWFTLHPAVAVWTWNEHRQSFFPDSMPNEYVPPSPYYTEPDEARVPLKTRLKAIVEQDFRSTYMADHAWTHIALGNGPTDWISSPESNALRMWAVRWLETDVAADLRADALAWGGTTTGSEIDAAQAMWWAALGVYGAPLGLTLYSNAMPHWAMYGDLVANSVMFDPFSCFFTHPNGTWAYFDQTHVYNRNGLPDPSLFQYRNFDNYVTTAGSSGGWSAGLLEHWIIDHVHLCFTLAKGVKVTQDTSFVALYNSAVANLPPLHTETFQPLALADMKASFTVAPQGTSSPYGLSLKCTWNGYDSYISEDSIPAGTGNYTFQANGSTIDLSLNYLLGGVALQTATPFITFSSCLLIEALDEQ